MHHFYQEGKYEDGPVFLLLHGTGGSEKDLLPIASMIDEHASVLGVKGNVSENGMARFFRRIREGVFDEEDLIERTAELHAFLDEAAEKYRFDRSKIVAVGYSNGANIAASLLFHYETSLNSAILFHPMVPRRGIELPDLAGTPIFIGAGTNDPIINSKETEELAQTLTAANASVDLHWDNMGHQLSENEVLQAKSWYSEHIKQ
ncbi:alpha/beta hydrolase [Sediminibacillus albus]|uniref:Phospholipase/carboxylesterase n=1 Tax=Sediminibacillus albus TaxID=407036 RepID=A0A1G8VRR1_9BACI|nr:alpha/beta hydrolase [Sediminibacillus albus]SDJ68684.1 phospholipase/carboxylesterase [Sediminibacillus albus]